MPCLKRLRGKCLSGNLVLRSHVSQCPHECDEIVSQKGHPYVITSAYPLKCSTNGSLAECKSPRHLFVSVPSPGFSALPLCWLEGEKWSLLGGPSVVPSNLLNNPERNSNTTKKNGLGDKQFPPKTVPLSLYTGRETGRDCACVFLFACVYLCARVHVCLCIQKS